MIGTIVGKSAALVGGVAVVIGFVLLNGGYVYKTTCPLASGGRQTSGTYAIDDIFPYIRKTTPPCYSHTGTRLALSALRIAPLGKSSADIEVHYDLKGAKRLANVLRDLNREWARETKLAAPLTQKQQSGTLTPDDTRNALKLLTSGRAKFDALRGALDAQPRSPDSQLANAQKLLSEWLGYQVAGDDAMMSGESAAAITKRNTVIAGKIQSVGQRLSVVIAGVQARYPKVDISKFLIPPT